jgi:hypothetical protein
MRVIACGISNRSVLMPRYAKTHIRSKKNQTLTRKNPGIAAGVSYAGYQPSGAP